MNNFGMNQMFMNLILMNNMNNIPINNQPNFMDNAALIQNYENKIRELEEIIKQKDFEIIFLKQKLNINIPNNNINMMNPMMNMNMEPMFYPSNPDKISINIKSNLNYITNCFKSDKTSILKERLILTYNYKPINKDVTIEENGITDGSIINVTDQIYTLHFKYKGSDYNVSLDGVCPLKQAIKIYCERFKYDYQKVLNKNIYFIYNGSKMMIFNETPIKDVFPGINPTIIVFDANSGAIG